MKKNYEKILPSYICDIQEINNLSKVMFMNNFPHHQFICVQAEQVKYAPKTTLNKP